MGEITIRQAHVDFSGCDWTVGGIFTYFLDGTGFLFTEHRDAKTLAELIAFFTVLAFIIQFFKLHAYGQKTQTS
jgi:hypothetical protein